MFRTALDSRAPVFVRRLATTLDGGPNPEGTNIGTWTDTTGVTHGFVLKDGVFTSFDVSGSTATTPNWISPQGVIVGGYVDSTGANHGFVMDNGQYTTVDFPRAASTILTGLNPSGELAGASCTVASCPATSLHSFTVSKHGVFTGFDPPGAVSSNAASINPTKDEAQLNCVALRPPLDFEWARRAVKTSECVCQVFF